MANIDVYLNTQQSKIDLNHVGRLEKTQKKHVFSYNNNAVQALSLTMPLRTESYSFQELHPIFQMNLPEGHLREVIERATAKQYGSDDLTMLALLGRHQIGQIAYAISGKNVIEKSLTTPDLQSLLGSHDGSLFSQLLDQFATTSGVAGVQPKVLLNLKSKATLPLESYIVKSWGNQYPELGCNEMVCLSLARYAGLRVPETHLSDNGKLLVSKRFDLVANESNEMANKKVLGFEDFCVLQGKTTREKYDASLESCANTIRQFVSPLVLQSALYDFFKLTLVNVLVRNGDAHLKNSGVVYDHLNEYFQGEHPNSERKLAPIFDIVSTVPYINNDTMALSLTGSKRWPKWKVLHKFAQQHCGLNNKKINQAVDEVNDGAIQVTSLLAGLSKKHAKFSPIAEVIDRLIKQSF